MMSDAKSKSKIQDTYVKIIHMFCLLASSFKMYHMAITMRLAETPTYKINILPTMLSCG